MLEKIKNLFKKKIVVQENIPDTVPQPIEIKSKQKLFHCYLCHNEFEVTTKMQFPTSVKACDKEFYFQGIGVQCPKCLQTIVYG
jgi:hypothetical protein